MNHRRTGPVESPGNESTRRHGDDHQDGGGPPLGRGAPPHLREWSHPCLRQVRHAALGDPSTPCPRQLYAQMPARARA
eukprot:12850462-Alexandrium_andersonii.AAC.1